MFERLKARLCARGDFQVYGEDYFESYAPTARFESVRIITALAAANKWKQRQVDVDNAFLWGDLPEGEIIYMYPALGFREYCPVTGELMVYKLRKSLYGLVQAAKVWSDALVDHLVREQGFRPLHTDSSVLVKGSFPELIVVSTLVDDILASSHSDTWLDDFEASMEKVFKIKKMGNPQWYSGVNITYGPNSISLDQKAFAETTVAKLKLQDAYSREMPLEHGSQLVAECKTPDDSGLANVKEMQSIAGQYNWLSQVTRPDLAHASHTTSRVMLDATKSVRDKVRNVGRYLLGTKHYCLTYYANCDHVNVPVAFCDADHAGCVVTRRSLGGHGVWLNGGLVMRSVKLQKGLPAANPTESEYREQNDCLRDVIHIRQFMEELGFSHDTPTLIYGDNRAAMMMASDPGKASSRSKQVDVYYHRQREAVNLGICNYVPVDSGNNIADIWTKVTTRGIWQYLIKWVMNVRGPPQRPNP